MIRVTWPELKNIIDSKGLFPQHIETANYYIVYAVDGAFTLETKLDRTTENADVTQFETSYKARSNTPLWQYDTDGAQIVRNKAAKKGWTFGSLPFEFETARLSDSLFSQDSLGNNRTFITLKAYNALNQEVTDPADYATITKTVVDFEPPYDYEIIGGDLRTLTSIDQDIRLWIVAAPDIPAPTGSKEMGGGINLKYLSPGNVWSVDGRVTKYATYNPVYHTSKIRLVFKYPAGCNEALQVIIQLYRP